MTRVTVVDYGMGNLFSVRQALEYCGAQVELTDDPEHVLAAEKLVLPGVGAFSDGMTALRQKGLVEPIRNFVRSQRPFLGICLGMQMMLETSEEFGNHVGLGLIPGKVVAIPRVSPDKRKHKIPHIGWNPLVKPAHHTSWSGSLLDQINDRDSFYFVHSFMAVPTEEADRLADCDYDGVRICSVISRERLSGCQFHPEKSGMSGLKVIRSFLAQC